jgi:hypothetical protein
MPTNDIPDEDEATVDAYVRIKQKVSTAAGADERLPLRVIVLFAITAGCLGTAVTPLQFIGLAAIMLLALDTAKHRR